MSVSEFPFPAVFAINYELNPRLVTERMHIQHEYNSNAGKSAEKLCVIVNVEKHKNVGLNDILR